MNLPHKLVFVDLETTGANPMEDRITEIGIVTVQQGVVSHWTSLVNPQVPISPFIEELTGINDAMVAQAPLFDALAHEVAALLDGGLFIAHNAKFDYGFLRNAFQRLGIVLKNDVLCTVKLSRKLYPKEVKHNLGALIERHRLIAQARHRALADADCLWQFWQTLWRDLASDHIDATVKSLLQKAGSARQAAPDLLHDMPNHAGVYIFHDVNDAPIFIGKASHLKRRAQTHFNSDDALERALVSEVKRVSWIDALGDIGAALREAKLLRDIAPKHNRQARTNGLCSWRLSAQGAAPVQAILITAGQTDLGSAADCYGLFRSRKKADARLREVAIEHGLCLQILGFESVAEAIACSAYGKQQCRGACIGAESPASHYARLVDAMADQKVQCWPFAAAVAMVESRIDGDELRLDFHVVDNWCYLGSAGSAAAALAILGKEQSKQQSAPRFDLDTYKILNRPLALGMLTVEILGDST